MALWTIRELSEKVAEALEQTGYEAPDNGQIRAIPNPRTIRYYTTLGLLDRPAEMDGRTALYDQRHLSQLVAIKRLQADGLPLARIQAALAAATADEIERIAGMSAGERPPRSPSRDESFWLSDPAEPSRPRADEPRAAGGVPRPAPTHQTFELGPGLLLVVDLRQHPIPDARALQRAAVAITGASETSEQ